MTSRWLFVGDVEKLVCHVALAAVLQHQGLRFGGVHCISITFFSEGRPTRESPIGWL